MEENKTKMKKSTKYLLIGTLVLFLSVLGASVAYYLARVQGTLNGRAAGTGLSLTIDMVSDTDGDLIPLDNDEETLNQAILGYGNTSNNFDSAKACLDINNYSVCQVYKITLTNNGTVPVVVNSNVTLSGANTPNIDCTTMDDEKSVSNSNSCIGDNTLANNDTINGNSSKDYYVVVYIKNLDEPQYDSGDFNGTITFTSTEGDQVKGRFFKLVNLVEHITSLYNDAEKTVVTAPSDASDSTKTLDYNYATSVNLMNDRHGGTTEDLNGGNIRYYGATPNNYIDIGDRTTDNQVILWRIIGVFDGKVRVVRDESIGSYSWDTSASNADGVSGINQWGPSGNYQGADLMKLLNPGYNTNQDFDTDGETLITVNNSLYWNSGSGKCYNGTSYANNDCSFTNSGLSESIKSKIVDQTIYLGGGNTNSIYTNQAYTMERGDNVIQNPSDGITRTLSWTGKVGLIYPSDSGYAVDLTSCRENLFYYYITTCANNNWLKGTWFITPYSSYVNSVWNVESDGRMYYYHYASNSYGVRPVLTLSSDVEIKTDGEGTSTKPYVLK